MVVWHPNGFWSWLIDFRVSMKVKRLLSSLRWVLSNTPALFFSDRKFNMKRIQLYKRTRVRVIGRPDEYHPIPEKYALVDDADFPTLSQWIWVLDQQGRVVRFESDGKWVYLHRQVFGLGRGDVPIAHRNGVNTDCRRKNLMIRTVRKRGKYPFKGIIPAAPVERGFWAARIKNIYLGTFGSLTEAAYAYNVASEYVYGDLGLKNEINEEDIFLAISQGGIREKVLKKLEEAEVAGTLRRYVELVG